jgi:hypothetical protein
MRVADHTGTTFVMRPGPTGWGAPFRVEDAISRAKESAIRQYVPHVQSGALSLPVSQSQASIFVNRSVAGEMGWQFEVIEP